MLMPKSGMQQMLESMIPKDVMVAIEKAKTEIPAFAEALNKRVTAIEESLARIECLMESVASKVDPHHAQQIPPTLQKLLQEMPTDGQERSF